MSTVRWEDPAVRTLIGHAVAAAAIGTMIWASGAATMTAPATIAGLWILAGLTFLHCVTVRRPVKLTTVAVDAIGTALLVAGTGAPDSPFLLLAVAGSWWAVNLPRPRGGFEYVAFFLMAYAILVLGVAWREGSVARLFESGLMLAMLAGLAHRYVRVDERAVELSKALRVPAFGPDELEVRQGLARALQAPDLAVDAVIAAGHLGLTAQQAELLAHLMIGLTNREIGDAVGVSEACVRYRLTRLYRALGVRRRNEAAQRARQLGLAGVRSGQVRGSLATHGSVVL
ncbi:MAG TPA: LuxR C-terminal-related transcriptional regulator [Candidatus Limnocylindrales bacterium]|jgi:DNA-binding CsgD family transcriptional regulator|nr:LuxR C-terminal-related transcriptional regulator [Candidatus Limnocylindrales bacterium]